MRTFIFLSLCSILLLFHIAQADENTEEEPLQEPQVTEKSEDAPADEAASEENTNNKKYALGSLCNYCSYCKFCELCQVDCPCEKSKKKPNCHLCKYCKYCSLCSVCDSVCKPGGVVDVVSSAIYNSLPAFDKNTKEKVDKDIESARKWIKEYL